MRTTVSRERVAVVTGGSRGIGYVTARILGQEGARVVIVSQDEVRLRESTARLRQDGIQVDGWPCDLSDRKATTDIADRLRREFAAIDSLINNAGIVSYRSTRYTSDELWDQTVEVNLTAAFVLIRGLMDSLVSSGRGAVVNVGSVVGSVPTVGMVPYCVAKSGLHQLTRALALELAPHGVRVNAVAPGFIRTDMFEKVNPLAAREAIGQAHPLGRVGSMDEVAAVIKFLCSDDASFVTGAVVAVDGGLSCALAVPDLFALSEAD